MTSPVDIFAATLLEAKTHPQFRALRDSQFHGEARALMNELYSRMGDPNGNFIYDLQGDGFHSRVFELACFAYLESAGLSLDRSNEKPDFLACCGEFTLAIEAATANPPTGRGTDISVLQMPELSEEQIADKVINDFPRRMASILSKKLKHGYHQLPQCAGKPLVLMIAPFFEPGAVFYTDEGLVECLYGPAHTEPNSERSRPFFLREDAAPISAVLYCNAFTVPRFFRLATTFNATSEIVAIRRGTYYIDHSESEFPVASFEYLVGSSSAPRETWSEGVTVFENPNALIPLPKRILPGTSTFSIRNGCLVRDIHGFHPVLSFMTVTISKGQSTEVG